MGLDLDTLRRANTARLPQFKASTGAPAHSTKDGSDWSPAQWLQAVIGELGEFAEVRMKYETGQICKDEYEEAAAKELADVMTYLDILARRAFDQLERYNGVGPYYGQGCQTEDSPAQQLMRLMASIGSYANTRKKLERGDYANNTSDFYSDAASAHLKDAAWELEVLQRAALLGPNRTGDKVALVHHEGVDLSRATIDKFNAVSQRVGSTIGIELAYGRSEVTVNP